MLGELSAVHTGDMCLIRIAFDGGHAPVDMSLSLAAGLKTEMLDNFLFDEEGEQQLTTYEKWEVIRHAAEQMLQVSGRRRTEGGGRGAVAAWKKTWVDRV